MSHNKRDFLCSPKIDEEDSIPFTFYTFLILMILFFTSMLKE